MHQPRDEGTCLDTSIVVAAVIHGDRSLRVASYFATASQITNPAFVSDLVRIEFAQAIKGIANTPSALSPSERRRHRLHRWGDLQEVREDWYARCIANLETFLNQFATLHEIAIDRPIIDSALSLMAVFQLDSNDAIHTATALSVGASTLATMDADFLKLAEIPGLDIHIIR